MSDPAQSIKSFLKRFKKVIFLSTAFSVFFILLPGILLIFVSRKSAPLPKASELKPIPDSPEFVYKEPYLYPKNSLSEEMERPTLYGVVEKKEGSKLVVKTWGERRVEVILSKKFILYTIKDKNLVPVREDPLDKIQVGDILNLGGVREIRSKDSDFFGEIGMISEKPKLLFVYR